MVGISHGFDNVKGEKLFKLFGINSNHFLFYLSYIFISLFIIIFG